MLVTWEGLALLFGWWATTIIGVAWIERRLSRMESDLGWLIKSEQRRERVAGLAHIQTTDNH